MVCLLPGIIITSKTFKSWDPFIHLINIEPSFSRGSKSEKLLIEGNFIIPTFISGLIICDFLSNKSKESSGGNLLFNHGIIPKIGI